MSMKAHLLRLNSFGMPAVATDVEAMYTKLVYLILLEPGKFQTHPTMGCGIRSKFRHNNDSDLLRKIQLTITNQINQFLPELTMIDISVNMKNQILGILINTEEGYYALSYDSANDVMDAPATKMLEDL